MTATDRIMRIKIHAEGPEAWKIQVTDADTGRQLPVLWDRDDAIVLRSRDGVLVATVQIEVDVIDVSAHAELAETLRFHGREVRNASR